MRSCRFCCLAFFGVAYARAQSPGLLLNQFRDAVQNKDLASAAEVAAKLDDAVQRNYRAALVTDADDRLKEVLSWLPRDTETFFFLRSPVRITPSELTDNVRGNPASLYTTDRLRAIADGRFYNALSGKMIRLAATGMRNMRSRSVGITPGLMPDADVAYFFFLDEPIPPSLFGQAEGSSGARPIWKGLAKIVIRVEAGIHQTDTRTDENWLALIHPDVLLLASTRELLNEVLARVAGAASDRGLPDTLREWAQLDPHASFWAMRHFARPGDANAIGLTMQFSDESDELDVRCLCASDGLPQWFQRLSNGTFEIHPSEKGVSRLTANVRQRGNIPFHLAIDLLGFGLCTGIYK